MHIAASGSARWLRLSEGRIKYQAVLYVVASIERCILRIRTRIDYFTFHDVISLRTFVRTLIMPYSMQQV
jgi:hypothetical protein